MQKGVNQVHISLSMEEPRESWDALLETPNILVVPVSMLWILLMCFCSILG